MADQKISGGMAFPDLLVVSLLQERFEFLSKNPHFVEFMLSPLGHVDVLYKYLGQRYVKEAIDYIVNNKLLIRPYYQADQEKSPSVAVISHGDEMQKFIGDNGYSFAPDNSQFNTKNVILQPSVWARWDSIGIDKDEMSVALSSEIDQKIWIGIQITNDDETAVVKGIYKKEDKIVLFLDKDLSTETPLIGWRAQTADRRYGFSVGTSLDAVNIVCELKTPGDSAVHRVISALLRSSIKSLRPQFDFYGLYDIDISYSPMLEIGGGADQMFQSQVSIKGKMADHWIQRQYELDDPYAGLDIIITPDCSDPDF